MFILKIMYIFLFQGDSGSPLVYDDPSGQRITIGVASFINTFGCGRPFLPSVYTKNSKYVDWLKDTVGSDVQLCFV